VERARLEKRGRPPSLADGQIAAIASVNDLVVVTANAKDFRRFRGLSIENWHSSR
jgi:tRNA(fMet)-specific endonuclease VapC